MIHFLGVYNYLVVILIMMTGLYITIANPNLIKKIIGLNLFQVSVFILYISFAYIDGGTAPIYDESITVYTSPLPHVLILTAIVVGISTTALALAIVVLIKKSFGTIEEDKIIQQMRDEE